MSDRPQTEVVEKNGTGSNESEGAEEYQEETRTSISIAEKIK